MREHTLYDVAVQHVLDTRGPSARVDMDAALSRVAEELERFARKRDRIVTVGATIAFVMFCLFAAHEVSARLDDAALVTPAFANVTLAIAVTAAFVAFAASRTRDRPIELEKRGQSLAGVRDPALAPVREVLKECLEGAYAVLDRDDVHVDRPVFASPHAVILFLPLQRHRSYRLPNAKRALDEQLKAVRAIQPKPATADAARSGAVARNAFLQSLIPMLCLPRFEDLADEWGNQAKSTKIKTALMEARELAAEEPSLTDTKLAKQVAARLEARGVRIGLSGSSSTEWLEQVLGGTGNYGWLRDYLSGDDNALPPKRLRKRRG